MISRQDQLDVSFRLDHIYKFLPLSLGFPVPPSPSEQSNKWWWLSPPCMKLDSYVISIRRWCLCEQTRIFPHFISLTFQLW